MNTKSFLFALTMLALTPKYGFAETKSKSPLLLQTVTAATATQCQIQVPLWPTGTEEHTVSLEVENSGEANVKVDGKNPLKVVRTTELKVSDAQVDKCRIISSSPSATNPFDRQVFKKCMTETLGSLNDYELYLPELLAFFQTFNIASSGTYPSTFKTSDVASGKVYFTSEFNPMIGISGFVELFDQNNNRIAQIYNGGVTAIFECK